MTTQTLLSIPSRDRLASAYLLIIGRGGNPEPVLTAWFERLAVPSIDQVRVEGDERITLEQIRDFQRQILLAPCAGTVRLGVIIGAQKLLPEASNALLKLLEDPPAHATILLTVEQQDQVLGTIISRCQRFRAPGTIAAHPPAAEIAALRQLPYYHRLQLAEEWTKNLEVVDQLDRLILGMRLEFLSGRISGKMLERLLRYRELLVTTNASPRLVAEAAVLLIGKENASL